MPRLISHHTSLCRLRTPRRRSESARLCAPRGGCCRFVMRSAGSSHQQTCDDRLWWYAHRRDFARGDARLFRDPCRMRCGASVTCAPLRRRQMACCSRACPYPAAALLCHLGPLLHFKKSASGCCQPPPAGGPLAADLSNCTRRVSVGDGRVSAGVSELGPAMSDGESVPDEL